MKRLLLTLCLLISFSAHAKTVFLECDGVYKLCAKSEIRATQCDKPEKQRFVISFDGKSVLDDEDGLITFKNKCQELGDKIVCSDTFKLHTGGNEVFETGARSLTINRATGALLYEIDTELTPQQPSYAKGIRGLTGKYEAQCIPREKKRLF